MLSAAVGEEGRSSNISSALRGSIYPGRVKSSSNLIGTAQIGSARHVVWEAYL